MTMWREVTVVMPYYNNPGMLQIQYDNYRGLDEKLKPWVQLIIVDDGSRKPATPVDDLGIGLQIYRMKEDIRWNQDACRNLGVLFSNTSWVLLTDIDHVVPERSLRDVVSSKLDPKVVYKFQRKNAPDLDLYKPHPNSWLMTKWMFDLVGGYDERLRGWYGTDADFRNHVEEKARIVYFTNTFIIRYSREVVSDASTPVKFGRKNAENSAALARLKKEREAEGKYSPKRFLTPWEKVYPC